MAKTKDSIQGMGSTRVKELEIPIVFHNYKLLKDKEIVLKGSNIYFIQGPNGVGKTSFLKALTSLQIASDDTPVKVTNGESEGYYEATIPAANGEMITIRHSFTDNDKGKFIAIREDGSKVSQVTEIRSLFNYTPINVNEFFAMSNSAEGRRKQRDIILKLMSDEERARFNQADLEEQHYYDQRTNFNRLVEQAENSIKAIIINQEDEALLPREKEAKDLIALYTSIRDSRKEVTPIKEKLADLHDRMKKLEDEMTYIKGQIEKEETRLIEKSDPKHDHITNEDLANKLAKGEEIITRITSLSTKTEMRKEWIIKRNENFKKSTEMSMKIDQCRKTKDEVVANSDLPVENISFEDGYLTIDGFQFKESQICESDAVLILANILAKINPGPVQVIGDASILDFDKLERLNKIAEANNKIMFVDEVVRDASNIVVVGYDELSKDMLNKSIDEVANGKREKSQKRASKNILSYPSTPSEASPTAEDIYNENNKPESSGGEEETEKPLF